MRLRVFFSPFFTFCVSVGSFERKEETQRNGVEKVAQQFLSVGVCMDPKDRVTRLSSCHSARILCHSSANHPVFLICNLGTFWIYLGYGLYLWASCIIIRFLRVHAVLRFKVILSGWKAYASLVLFLLIFSALLPFDKTTCYLLFRPLFSISATEIWSSDPLSTGHHISFHPLSQPIP